MADAATLKPAEPSTGFPVKKLVVLVVLLAVLGIGYYSLSGVLTLEWLGAREAGLREFQSQHPLLTYGGALLIYAAITGLSLPGAAVLTLTYGWFFGLWRGLVLVSFASTLGATIAFLISRYLFRDAVQARFGERIEGFNEALRREGPYFLFAMRLFPGFPFFVINAAMGLTPIRTSTYWWVSQLGMLPGTLVYVYAGSSVPSLSTLANDGIGAAFPPGRVFQLIAAFAVLGLFPLLARWGLKLFKRQHTADAPAVTESADSK